MELKFENIDKFIKEYYFRFLNLNVDVVFKNNVLNINFIYDNKNIDFWITIWEEFFVKFNKEYDYLVGFKKNTIKLLEYLNKNVKIPISFKLKKQVFNTMEKSVFIFWNDGNLWNISENNLKLLKFSNTLYTNNKEWLTNLLKILNIENKEIFLFSDIFNLDFKNVSEIILFQYWDYFESEQEINKLNSSLKKDFDRFFIQPYYSNFINKYSLSHTNYWSLLYLWLYDKTKYEDNFIILKNKITKFIENTNKITSKLSIWNMLSLSWLSIEFKSFNELEKFIWDTKDILDNNYLVELLLEIKDWYYNIINYIDKLDFSHLKNEMNISYITIFIYPKIWDFFVWYSKFNLNNSSKTLTFLSAPLTDISEFTHNSLKELRKSKYIFWESLSWLKKFLDDLNITYSDKKLFYWDDIEWINEYIKNNKIKKNNKIQLVLKIFPELINLLNNSEKIYFLTDWWAPCILDPWDNIKKYVNLYYKEYSVIWIKWSNVISTVLLWAIFKYKYIYWASFIYTILPNINYLKEINFFSKDNFFETLIIFYSFWKRFKDDLIIFEKIFDKNIKIQIIWDVWTEREYNKVFTIKDFSEYEINYILNNLDNLVYLLTF